MAIQRREEEAGRVVALAPTGSLDVDHAPAVHDELARLARLRKVQRITIDLAEVDGFDSAGGLRRP